MAINYSLSERNVTVKDPVTGVKTKVLKRYAKAQANGKMTLDEFCALVARTSKGYSASNIKALTVVLASALVANAKMSQRSQMGELGYFGHGLSSEGILDAQQFSPQSNVKKVYVKWTKGSRLANLTNATFTLISTRDVQKAGKKAQKQASSEIDA